MREKNEDRKRRSDLIKQLLQTYQPKNATDLQRGGPGKPDSCVRWKNCDIIILGGTQHVQQKKILGRI